MMQYSYILAFSLKISWIVMIITRRSFPEYQRPVIACWLRIFLFYFILFYEILFKYIYIYICIYLFIYLNQLHDWSEQYKKYDFNIYQSSEIYNFKYKREFSSILIQSLGSIYVYFSLNNCRNWKGEWMHPEMEIINPIH